MTIGIEAVRASDLGDAAAGRRSGNEGDDVDGFGDENRLWLDAFGLGDELFDAQEAGRCAVRVYGAEAARVPRVPRF